jgi:hypothetical protein
LYNLGFAYFSSQSLGVLIGFATRRIATLKKNNSNNNNNNNNNNNREDERRRIQRDNTDTNAMIVWQ